MENIHVSLRTTFKWWTKPALFCTALYAVVRGGVQASEKAVEFVCKHGIRVEIVE